MARVLRILGASLGLGMGVGIALAGGCAAGSGTRPDGTGGSGGESFTTVNASSSSSGGLPECANFSAEASKATAAMLIVLDGSASMKKSSKWSAAQLAVISAIDANEFDTMSLGLLVFPRTYTDPPVCLCEAVGAGSDIATCIQLLELATGQSGVSCGVQILPQVPISEAGTNKSDASTGVRRQIYDWLVNNQPLSNGDDGSPIYDALKNSYSVLKAKKFDRRIAVLITDGGFSCTSVAMPARAAYDDLNGCPDWEIPDSVNQLIAGAHDDPTAPINTFIVGVPGSNSTGQKLDGFDTPPYNMLLALSTYAVSGSPDTVDPTCSKDAVYMQGGAAPAKPCHIDLSTGAFDASVLAKAISDIRGKALGCLYALPEPPPGKTIDPNLVNVNVTVDGNLIELKKRKDPLDDCAVDGCWDYTADGKVEILGKTCNDLGGAGTSKVDIYVGCNTIIK